MNDFKKKINFKKKKLILFAKTTVIQTFGNYFTDIKETVSVQHVYDCYFNKLLLLVLCLEVFF